MLSYIFLQNTEIYPPSGSCIPASPHGIQMPSDGYISIFSNKAQDNWQHYTCSTCVKHVYYMCFTHVMHVIIALCNTPKTTYVLHVYHICNTHGTHLVMYNNSLFTHSWWMTPTAYTFADCEDRKQKVNFLEDQSESQQGLNPRPFTCRTNSLQLSYTTITKYFMREHPFLFYGGRLIPQKTYCFSIPWIWKHTTSEKIDSFFN